MDDPTRTDDGEPKTWRDFLCEALERRQRVWGVHYGPGSFQRDDMARGSKKPLLYDGGYSHFRTVIGRAE